MSKLKIFYYDKGKTLSVWFDDPKNEAVSEETSEEIILIKDKKGKVIGFEVLNYLSSNDLKNLKNLPVETEILA